RDARRLGWVVPFESQMIGGKSEPLTSLVKRAEGATEGEHMTDAQLVQQQAAVSLERLWPRLEITFRDEAGVAPADWRALEMRLRHEWEGLLGRVRGVYGGH